MKYFFNAKTLKLYCVLYTLISIAVNIFCLYPGYDYAGLWHNIDRAIGNTTYDSCVSLSDTLETDGDGSSLSLLDTLCDESDMAEDFGRRELCASLRSLIDTVLTPRERQIILWRYGLDGEEPKTQRETAALCGISRSYISRIEKRALEKLKKELDEE